MTLRVLDILFETMVDGVGLRTSVYVAGCAHNCKNCHNPQSHDFNGGHVMEVDYIVDLVNDDEFADLTLTGGDPLYQVDACTELCKKVKETSNKNIWLYTGFTFEEIIASPKLSKILPYIDTIVDGPYIDELRDEELPFRGSSNQRIIHLKDKDNYGKF